MELSKETLLLLEDIERRIDPETEEDLEKQWLDFTYGRFDGDISARSVKKLRRLPSSRRVSISTMR